MLEELNYVYVFIQALTILECINKSRNARKKGINF